MAVDLKDALIQAGYPVYDNLLISGHGVSFQTRTPITTTAESGIAEMDKSQTPPGRDGGHQFPPGPKVSKKDIKAVNKDPAKHLSDLFAKEYAKKKIKEQGVAEGNELARMLEHAGINMQESKWDTVGGPETFGLSPHEVILRFPHEVRQFMRTGQVDEDLYHALYDWYNQKGMMPYGIAKDRDGDSREWIAMQLGHECDIGLEENLITAQSMPVTTESGSCNMTAEGEYCPEHGLAECGYMEGMAPVVMDEAPQDPINYNAAITGSYYESKDGDALLARIKSLALLK